MCDTIDKPITRDKTSDPFSQILSLLYVLLRSVNSMISFLLQGFSCDIYMFTFLLIAKNVRNEL